MAYEGGKLSDLVPSAQVTDDAVRELADAGAERMLQRVREFTPVDESADPGRPPGTLRDSWRRMSARRTAVRGHRAYEAQVLSADPAARWVERGVTPHLITPKPGGRLRFKLATGGAWVTARVVRHPGTRPQYPLLRASVAAEVEFEQAARPVLERWAERSTRGVR